MAQTIHTRQLMLESSIFRTTVSEVVINTPASTEFIKLEATGNIAPASITLDAIAYNIINPTYLWEYKNNDPSVTSWTAVSGGTNSSLNITSTAFSTYRGSVATQVSFRVTCKDSINVDVLTSTATQVITYSDETADSIIISNSSPNVIIGCSVDGTPNTLANTSIKLQVTRNGKVLTYGTTGANTWSIGTPTISPNSLTLGTGSASGDGLSYSYANITAITADEVLVTFPITMRNANGTARSVVNTTQKFVKNRPGFAGLSVELTNDTHAVPADSDGSNPVLTGSGTDIYVYDGSTQLEYNGVGNSTGTWAISITGTSGVTAGSFTDQGTFARLSNLTGMTAPTGSITFTITGRSLSNNSFTVVKTQTFSRNNGGVSAGWYGVEISTPVVYKDSANRSIPGTTSPIKVSGYKYVGDTKSLYGWLRITPYIGATAGTPGYMYQQYDQTPNAASDAEYYVVNLMDDTNPSFNQARIDATAILDTEQARVVFKGNSATRFSIDNAAVTFAKDKAGVISPSGGITLTTSTSNFTGSSYVWRKNGNVISGATSESYVVPTSDYSSVNTNTYVCTVTGTINGVAGQTLTDSITIPRLDDGTNSPTVVLSNENVTFPSPLSGYSGIIFTGGDCTVTAYLGTVQLTYNTTGANTFSVSQLATGATVATGTAGVNSYSVPAPTAMSTDTAYTDVTLTIRDAAGVALASTITRRISYSLSRKGDTGTAGINTATVALYAKNTSSSVAPSAFSGTFTYDFTNSTLSGGTLNGWSTSAPAITNGEYLWARYATASSNTSQTTITATSFSTAAVIGIGGTNGNNGKTYELTITGGIRSFTYDQAGANPSPSATSYSVTLTEDGVAVTPSSYTWTTGGQLTSTGAGATFTPTVAGAFVANSNTFVQCTTVYAGVSVTRTIPIAINRTGSTGAKTVQISAYQWSSTGLPTLPTTSFDYTWSNGTKNPSSLNNNWSFTAIAPSANNQTLYEIVKLVTESNGEATQTTGITFSGAASNSIGFRQDGTIGTSVKNATTYIYYQTAQATSTGISDPTFTLSSSSPYNFSTGALTFLSANGWAQTPPTYQAGTSSNNYWYKLITISQSDTGTQVVTLGTTLLGTSFTNLVTFTSLSTPGSTTIDGANITTGTVNANRITTTNLSAINSNLGLVNIGASGSSLGYVKTLSRNYGDTSAGFFLGYDSTAYKFELSNSDRSKLFQFDSGGNAQIKGVDILGGQTAYNTGTGFFLGSSGSFSVGTGPNSLRFDGTTLTVPAVNITGTIPSTVTHSGDVTGTLNSSPVGTVVTNAGNGATAFTGTTAYRTNSAPTNNGVFGSITQANTADGNVVVTVNYTYTQGANIADSLILFYREGGGTVVAADPAFITNAVGGYITFTLKPNTTYTFGIQAVRRTESGLVGTAITTSSSITTNTANYTGNINNVAASTVQSGAADGASALSAVNNASTGLSAKLSRAANDTLISTITLQTAGTLLVGTANDGVYLSAANGLLAKKSGATTFQITTGGDATFSGTVSVGSTIPTITGTTISSGAGALITSTGNFAVGNTTNNIVWNNSSLTIRGNLSSSNSFGIVQTGAGSIFGSVMQISANSSATWGLNVGGDATIFAIVGSTTSNGGTGVRGTSNSTSTGYGVTGSSNGGVNSVGVYGFATPGTSGIGIDAYSNTYIAIRTQSAGTATALYVGGSMAITSTNLVTNLNADMVDGRHVGTGTNQIPINNDILNPGLIAGQLGWGTNKYAFVNAAVTGTATATYSGVKPGAATTNSWLQIRINGADWYIPIWPA
jgi:hypothetical protein